MTLVVGTRLGPYEVLGLIGAGGMGEVYKARDPRLGREVAIKVLPAERLADPGRRARFLQEARAASALSHPNIVTIHEIEAEGTLDFLVMEHVAGRTLDALIPRRGMRVSEALRIAIPLADALASAHAAGIVHRDLKPANVMLTPDGTVKVLDFGLAKLLQREEPAAERSTTVEAHAHPLSGAGTVAGTVGYMSPEQAVGMAVDGRSDIFSFGALLYELVTGRRAFAGASSAETLAAILKEQPRSAREIAPDIPAELERILLRCLRKDPSRRFQSMSDVKVELQEIKEESDSQATVPAVARGAPRRRRFALAAIAVLLLVVATAATLWRGRARPGEGPAPRLVQLTSEPDVALGSFSPDGTQVAYVAPGSDGRHPAIWVRLVGEAETRRLTTDAGSGDFVPAWSPDGRQIAFLRFAADSSVGFVHLVSALGGPARRVLDFPAGGQPSWSPDGRWLAVRMRRSADDPFGPIYLIPTGGGEARQVTFPHAPAYSIAPAISPDGRELAYFHCEGAVGVPACDVWVTSLDGDAQPQGSPRRLTHLAIPAANLAWTRDGRWVVYNSTNPRARLHRVRADGRASPEIIQLAGIGAYSPFTARLHDRLGYTQLVEISDIYRLELGGRATPLLASTSLDDNPQYSPDGRRIVFQSAGIDEDSEGAIWLADADGSNVTRLTRGPGRAEGSPRWSPDGRTIAFDSHAANGHFDIWTIGVDGAGLRQITRDPADENMPSWSRDGRFVYYGSNRTGRYEIWRVAAEGGSEAQVTRTGGFLPFESVDGRSLYYLRQLGGSLLVRPTAGGEERTIAACIDLWGYAVGPRGVFHIDCPAPGTPAGAVRVLRHWDPATSEDHEVGAIDTGSTSFGLSASPDGRHVVYTRYVTQTNLMMIENFR